MSASAADVAAALRTRVVGLPTKKLHKLLYFAQGHHLAAYGAPLFHETLSAWDMGPVVGPLWKSEKASIEGDAAALSERELNTVGYVVSRYGSLSGRDLEILSHGQDPWRLADAGRAPGHSERIESKWIEEWFRNEGDDDEPAPDWLAGAAERAARPARADDPERLLARLTV